MKKSTADADRALLEQTIQRGFRLLRFPEPLEQAFAQAHARDRSFKLNLAGVNAALIFGVIFAGAYFASPSPMTVAFCLQLGAFGPVVLLSLVALRKVSSPKLMEWLVVPVAALASYLVACDPLGVASDLAFTKAAELFSIVIYVGVFTRFWPMVVLSTLLFAMLVDVVIHATDVVGMNRPETCLLMVTVCFYALYACYTREHNDREAFLLDLREADLLRRRNEANEKLKETARTDRLTGVANRRAFDEICAQYASSQDGRELGLLLIDIDHFKTFNDLYGHPAGDQCLCDVTEAIAACLRRPVDTLARWGGEEFAVLLPNVDEALAQQIAERICQAVADRGIAHARSSCAPCVTVSIGLAVARVGPHAPLSDLVQAADDALYQAKALGRNRFRAGTLKPLAVEQA